MRAAPGLSISHPQANEQINSRLRGGSSNAAAVPEFYRQAQASILRVSPAKSRVHDVK